MANMFETAVGGYQAGLAIEKDRRALKAATDKYGAAANDPGLFSALEGLDQSKRAETRAAESHDLKMSTGRAQERRIQQAFDMDKKNAETTKRRQAVLGLVNGLRSARDRGEDVGEAFDALTESLPALGVDPQDIPAMREELLKDPSILDDYHASLAGPSKMTASERRASDEAQKAKEEAKQGRVNVSRTVGKMRTLYDRLDELGGIRSTEAGRIDSMGRYAAASPVGRMVGTVLGTEEESIRRSIEGLRPSLINAMKSAESMGARMFDSNKDMELWLATVTDPSQDIQTVKRLLDEFESKYGAALNGEEIAPIAPPNTDEYQRQDGSDTQEIHVGFKDPDTGAVFQGGDPGDPTNWTVE